MPLLQRSRSRDSSYYREPDLHVLSHPNFRKNVDAAVRCNVALLCGLAGLSEEDVQLNVEVSQKQDVLPPALLTPHKTL